MDRARAPAAGHRTVCARRASSSDTLVAPRPDQAAGPDASRPGRLLLPAQALHRRSAPLGTDPSLEPTLRDGGALARQRPVRRLLSADAALCAPRRGDRRRALPSPPLRPSRVGRLAIPEGGGRLG